MKTASRKKLFRALTVAFLSLAIVLSALGEVAAAYAPALNYALKTASYRVVEDDTAGETAVYFSSGHPDTESVTAYGQAVSWEAEAEGMVLLKNKNAFLPLQSGSGVSPVLQTAYNFSYGSSGSGAIDATRYDDLKTALEGAGFSVNETLWRFYADHPSRQAITYNRKGEAIYKVSALPWSDYTDEAKASIGETGGAALAVIGRLGGEGADLSTKKSDGYDDSYLSLTAEEIEILAELTRLKRAGQISGVAVLLNTASAFETAFLDDDWTVTVNGQTYTVDVDACLWVGNVGMGGIRAVAQALCGQVSPSGKLPDTYVKDNFSSPAAAAWAMTNASGTFAAKYENSGILSSEMQTRYGVYLEGIYVDYRYYETRYKDAVLGRGNAGDFVYADDVSRPFNDQEDARIGIGIWLNEQSAREIYLRPFQAAVAPSRGNAHGVMSSFNRAGCVWTSSSPELMETILREEFGFDGVVLTDMALGQNAYMSYDAVLSGTDLFLDPAGAPAQWDVYAQSPAFRQAVRRAAHRYLYVVSHFSAAMNGFSAASRIEPITPWWQALILALEIAFAALGAACAMLLARSLWRERQARIRRTFVL